MRAGSVCAGRQRHDPVADAGLGVGLGMPNSAASALPAGTMPYRSARWLLRDIGQDLDRGVIRRARSRESDRR